MRKDSRGGRGEKAKRILKKVKRNKNDEEGELDYIFEKKKVSKHGFTNTFKLMHN